MSVKRIKIAIDGPAASGKSTTAQRVAKELGYTYIDSGAMYRAVTLAALENGIPVTDTQKVGQLAANLQIEFVPNGEKPRIFLNGKDVSDTIRQPVVTQHINPVAANPIVREILVARQREMGQQGGVVMDGRDIGTVVFPDAELKIFMSASAEERARRRVKEFGERGEQIDFDAVLREIRQRDAADENRNVGPLRKADDAIEIDTTNLSIDEQVKKIVRLAREKLTQDK
jgi:cytidylate kinase